MENVPLKIIIGTYKQLLADAHKRSSQVETLVNDSLQILEGDKSKLTPSLVAEHALKPFPLLVQHKSNTVSQHILSIYQILAASQLLSPEQKLSFFEVAEKLSDVGNEMVIVKVMQVTLIIVTSKDMSDSLVNEVLKLCMKMFKSKSQNVKNNVLAILRQMYGILFQQYSEKLLAKEENKEIDLGKTCYDQMNQLTEMAGDKYKQIAYKGLGMDMLTIIFSESSLIGNPKIVELIEKQYVPCLTKYLTTEANSYPILSRAVKSAAQLMISFQRFYNFLQPIVQLLNSQYNWQRYLALEAFCSLFENHIQLNHINSMINNSTHTSMLTDIIRVIELMIPKIYQGIGETTTALNLIHGNKIREITEAIPTEPPNPNYSQHLILLSEILTAFLKSLEEVLKKEGIILGELPSQPFTLQQNEKAVSIMESTWKPVHNVLEYIIKNSNNELCVRQSLEGIKNLLKLIGSIGVGSAVHTIVGRLCAWSLPANMEELRWENGYKCVLVCNTICNIAKSLHKILDQRIWIQIFKFLERISCSLNKNKPIDISKELEQIQFNGINRKISDNVQKYSPSNDRPKTESETTPKGHVLMSAERDVMLMFFPRSKKVEEDKKLNKKDTKSVASLSMNKETSELPTPGFPEERALPVRNQKFEFAEINGKDKIRNEIDKLKNSLDSLFTFSSVFDDKTLNEFIAGLGQLATNSSAELAISNAPSKIELNIFGMKRMIETAIINISRIYCIWEYLAAHFEFLSKLKGTKLRPLAISALTCIIMNIFEYHKTKSWTGVKSDKWNEDNWQTTALSPLMNAINIDCVTEVVSNLRHIIENCGLFITKEGWKVVLGILEKIISPQPTNVATPSDFNDRINHAFKCVEHICHNSLYKIDISNVDSLIATICYFTNMRDDINTSLLSVAFLQNVSDYMSHQQASDTTSEETLSEIWVILFNRLKEAGTDERGELRHTAYRTLDQITEIHGAKLTLRVWSYVLHSLSDQLLQYVTMNYFNYTENAGKTGGDKAVNEAEKNSEEYQLKVKSWEDSVRILHTSFLRIIIKLSTIEGTIPVKDRNEAIDKAWSILLKSWLTFAKSNSFDILASIYKSIQLMMIKFKICVYNQIECIWQILATSINYAINKKSSTLSSCRPLFLKLISPVMEVFETLFVEGGCNCEFLMSDKFLTNLYELLRNMIDAINTAEGSRMNPARLNSEEREIFSFIEYLPRTFGSHELHEGYLKFLMQFLEFKSEIPLCDGYIRRALLVIKTIITKYEITNDFLKKLLEQLYPKLSYIISLRYNAVSCKIIMDNTKKFLPLWLCTGKFFLSISTFLIDSALYDEKNTGVINSDDEETKEATLKPQELNEEMQNVVWTNTLSAIKEIMKDPDSSIKQLDRSLAESIIQGSQALGIDVINFVVNILIPKCKSIAQQKELIKFIDNCTNTSNIEFYSNSSNIKETLPGFCMSALIGLCNDKKDDNEKLYELKQKISGMTTRILVNRCKSKLKQYVNDEKRNGQVPLPKQREIELIQLIEDLRNISVFPNSLPKKEGGASNLLSGRKAHLIYIMPELVECITTKEFNLRKSIKDVIQDVNKMMLGELVELSTLPDEESEAK